MAIRTEDEVRVHKKEIEDVIENLRNITDKDYSITSTIATLQDEVEVLRWVIREPSDHVGAYA